LRKIAKLLEAEDLRLARIEPACDAGPAPGDALLAEAARLLAEDVEFPPAALASVRDAAERISGRQAEGLGLERRPVNVLRHIVYGAIGVQTADWDFVDGQGALSAAGRTVLPGVRIFLEDIRSPYNVGSMFRAAESFGVEKVFLSPLCASPDHPRAARSSMGCTELVPWERARLEDIGGPYFALETGGTPLDAFPFPNAGLLIIGSEELGVSPAALSLADSGLGRVSIPTIGAKGSLNVSIAFGIAARAWCAALMRNSSFPA
jgi:TrmH family RNA methyltransferase